MTTMETRRKDISRPVLRVMYGLFVLLAAYNFFYKQDYGDAAMNLGLALIFDPFDPAVPWDKRPRYQRAWLIIHLLVTALVLILRFI